MKISNLLFALFALSLVSFTGCVSSEGDEVSGSLSLTSGNITLTEVQAGQNLTLKANGTFNLLQALKVKDGGTINIEEGVVITTVTSAAVSSASLFIVIEQGGRMNAIGTADKPIVITSENKTSGDWGGLIICGNAPINLSGGTGTIEIGNANYGGTNSSDNSGIIKYLRVEYTGSKIGDTKEHNGISFYGVGSGTTVEYVQAYKGNDDGFEWYGGTVNGKYLVSSGNGDDSFDWTDGWNGTVTEAYAIQDASSGGRLIEADNLEDNNSAAPYSNPTWSNVTLIGSNLATTEGGFELRRGTKGDFSNFYIKDVKDKPALRISNTQTADNFKDGSLVISNFKAENTDGNYTLNSGITLTVGEEKTLTDAFNTTATGASFSTWKGTWVKDL